jgi:hypothetical protein
MATFSIRRLSDATLTKYQRILAEGGELTPRQKRALEGHALITDRAFVNALLRPDKPQEIADHGEGG